MSPASPAGRRPAFASILAALALLAGCAGGDERVAVKGTVKLNGAPVTAGVIHLVPADETEKLTRAGGTITDGAFDIPAEVGPNRGRYKVYLSWPKPTGKKLKNPDPVEAARGVPWVEETQELMPKRYAKDGTLTAEFTRGVNPLDFDLKSD